MARSRSLVLNGVFDQGAEGREAGHVPRALALLVMVFAISAAHFAISREDHAHHVVHVVFGALFLVPIVAAGTWLPRRWAIGIALMSTALYLVHARVSWAGEPYENANQVAMAAVYLFVAVVTTVLAVARDAERLRGLAAVLDAQRDAAIQAVASLSSALRHRDDGTAEHCKRAARLCAAMGGPMGLPQRRIELLGWAALVHDVGKIGVRDDVLFKPEELTPSERTEIERHPAAAAEILSPIRGAEEVAAIVLAHHECPDGSGYPFALTGDRIPLEAHILRVVDVYDALRERRSYKEPMSCARALAVLEKMAGKVDGAAVASLRQILHEPIDGTPLAG
jgi:putative nucleotidyltransferase with HDIG domain